MAAVDNTATLRRQHPRACLIMQAMEADINRQVQYLSGSDALQLYAYLDGKPYMPMQTTRSHVDLVVCMGMYGLPSRYAHSCSAYPTDTAPDG